MKKRVIALTVCILLLMQAASFAQGEIGYGDTVKLLPMAGEFPSSEYWNMYSGREACEISCDRAYRGETSLKVDVNKIKNAERAEFNFETQKAYLYGADQAALFFEWYVYGLDEDIYSGRVKFSMAFEYSDGSKTVIRDGINYELPDENGWVKIWSVVPKSVYGNILSCTMGILYDPNHSDAMEVDFFYLDEMAIRNIPSRLYIQDISAKEPVDLSMVRVFGVDFTEKKDLIKNSSFFNWSVVSGNGSITDDKLIYTGAVSGDVIVRCEYFSMTADFTVSFKRDISYPDLSTNEDESISVTVCNDTGEAVSSTVVFALYDGNRLYSAQVVEKTVPPSATALITSEPIRISVNINEPNIRVFGWDGSGGLNILK